MPEAERRHHEQALVHERATAPPPQYPGFLALGRARMGTLLVDMSGSPAARMPPTGHGTAATTSSRSASSRTTRC
jgi:hypothetical protein